jgi:hypothetical protein
MSNLLSYLPIGKRIGETVNLPYNGDIFTALDGSVWKATSDIPLAYSSTYAALLTEAPQAVTAAATLNGPFASNKWRGFGPRAIIGASAGGSTWLMIRNTGNFDYYYTSTDGGASWTKRTLPVTGKTWGGCLWDGTNFVLYANGTAATGVQESTDGITWTARTAISLTVAELIYNGSVYLAWPAAGGTACATSPDRTTWSSRVCSGTNPASNQIGLGTITWNAGAGLFIAGTNTANTYQTSPDGITWTNRTGLDFLPNLGTFSSVFFASSATVTIAVGNSGVIATTTNGTSWTERTMDANYDNTSLPSAAFWDGTYFVVLVNGGIVYYSTDGITWTKSAKGNFWTTGVSSAVRTPTGLASISTGGALHLTDPSSSTNNNIIFPGGIANIAGTTSYMRIL